MLTPVDPLTDYPELRFCPHCNDYVPRSEFGISRARPDGLNLYCRKSIRIKMKLNREARKAYRNRRNHLKEYGSRNVPDRTVLSAMRIARAVRKMPTETGRVKEAIRLYGEAGCTQRDIARVTKLHRDELCDQLAELLLHRREIRTEVVRGQRMYFINEAGIADMPPRKESVMSFSVIRQLMPGKPSQTLDSQGAFAVKSGAAKR